jgi:hypothetical protein
VKILNDDRLEKDSYSVRQLMESLLTIFRDEKVYLNDKERYILLSTPTIFIVKNALLVYQLKEGFGYLNSVLALSLESAQVGADYFNEYTLSQRGRQSQGVSLFKNQILSLTEDSKLIGSK